MDHGITRRDWLASGVAAAGLAGVGLVGAGKASAQGDPAEPFGYCLNTSTIQGQKLTLADEIDLVAEVGYRGIEPWTRELDAHVKAGGSLADLGKRARDRGVSIEDVIGFFEWAVDDDARRARGLEEARRNLAMVQAVGGKRIAAPAFGATEGPALDLRRVADRYRALCEVAAGFGVVPLVEVWGFSRNLTQLGDAAMVAIASGRPEAAVLPDVYHLRKGGSAPGGLALLRGSAIGIVHVNDYPEAPTEALSDADRVYPGDGVAPLGPILRTLAEAGYRGMLSLELFNKAYWKQDARGVARTGLARMKSAVRAALG